jgi:hypothetical protein
VTRKAICAMGAWLLLWDALCVAQEPPAPDRLTIPFSDPTKPRKLIVKSTLGSVTIRGYDGKDAIIESTGLAGRRTRDAALSPGMHRLDQGDSPKVTEASNMITVEAPPWASVAIQVPVETSLSVQSVVGTITIDNVSGELEVEDVNGAVTITNAAGSMLVHSMNGEITASVAKVTTDKAMSFSTMNGTIDVTLPANLKANFKMKTDNGDIYTDFDVKLDAGPDKPEIQDGRDKGGRYRIRMDRTVRGTINGGGPEIQFTTYNGRILIHKK